MSCVPSAEDIRGMKGVTLCSQTPIIQTRIVSDNVFVKYELHLGAMHS